VIAVVATGCEYLQPLDQYNDFSGDPTISTASAAGQVPNWDVGAIYNTARVWWVNEHPGKVSQAEYNCIVADGQAPNPNGVRILWRGHDEPFGAYNSDGVRSNVTHRQVGAAFDTGPTVAVSQGCNTPANVGTQFGGFVPDPIIVLNKSYPWTKRKLCVVLKHEIGHHVGEGHGSDVRVMRIPIPNPQAGYPGWNFGYCNQYNV
jgi:hypothetical protein